MPAHSVLRNVFLYCLAVLSLLMANEGAPNDLSELLKGQRQEEAKPSERVITTGDSVQDDRKISLRLEQIYSQIPSLQSVVVDVNSGVAILSGEVDSAGAEARALEFARQVDGVVEVENRMTVDLALRPRVAATWNKISDLANSVVAALPLLALAVATLLAFWFAGRWLAARETILHRIAPNHFIATLFGQLLQIGFGLFGIATALVLLDATALLGTILGAAGIIGLAVGFAVRDTVENYISSILLSLRNPFEVNDLVNVDGHEGNVVKLTSRATVLLSPDGNHIRIPNAAVFKAVIINFTRHPERRFGFDIGVDTEQNLKKAQALALDTLLNVVGVLKDPPPMVVVEALGDSTVVLKSFGWVDQRRYGFLKVRSESIRAVKEAFDEAGIVMPVPMYKISVADTEIQPAEAISKTLEAPLASGASIAADSKGSPRIPTGDVSVDRTIERKVAAEERASAEENLLDERAAHEL